MGRKVSFLLLFLFLLCSQGVYAASLTVSSDNKSFSYDSEIEIKTSLFVNSQDNTNYFLRGVFFKPGTSDYCGLTWNGKEFFSGPYTKDEGWKNFFPVSIQSSSWSGSIKVKFDSTDSGCKDSGSYNFKVERFTNSGSGIFDPQEELHFAFTVPTQTPSPAPPSKASSASMEIGATIKPSVVVVQLAENKVSSDRVDTMSTEIGSRTDTAESSPSASRDVLSASVAENSPSPTIVRSKKQQENYLGAVFLILSFGILSLSCGILLFQKFRKKEDDKI